MSRIDVLAELRFARHLLRRIEKTIERQGGGARKLQFTLIRLSLDTGQIIEGEITSMVISDTQQATLEFGAPLDRKGKPAKVEPGSVAFSIDNPAAATLTPDPDNQFKVLVVAGDPTPDGSPATITITADANLGAERTTITGVEPLIVTSGEAVGFGAAVSGDPVEQP